MTDNILFGKEARQSLMRGIKILSDAVLVTYGPSGRNVILGSHFAASTRDGVSVTRGIEFADKSMNQGASILKQAAAETLESSGDGTTASICLAYNILIEAEKLLDAGANPIDLKRGIDEGVLQVTEQIKEMAIPCDSTEKIRSIATISGNNDPFIGQVVGDAYEQIGQYGMIHLTDSKTGETYVEVVKGMEIESGFISSYFSNTPKFTCELNEVAVIVCAQDVAKIEGTASVKNADGSITEGTGLLGVLEHCTREGISVLIVGKEVDSEVIGILRVNKGELKSCAVRAPYYGFMQKEFLNDIAAVTGATVIDQELGLNLKEMKWEHVGYAKKIIADQKTTSIIGGAGDTTERVELLKGQYETSKDVQVQKRLAKLSGGVAVIYAGAPTEVAQKEIKDRLDDAYKAVRSAISEGIVEGGGTALLRCEVVQGEGNKDFLTGVQIIQNILTAPITQILRNAGKTDKEISEIILKVGVGKEGYNAKTMKFEKLVESGVIDPAKVIIQSLRNAASVAGIICLTGAVAISEQ